MRLETKRLILRNFKKSDLRALVENINNLKVSQYLLVVPFPYTKADAEWWINHCFKVSKENPPKSIEIAIESKSEKKIIGAIGLSKIDYSASASTFGYWLGEKYWRQGIMSEALNEALKFAFEKLKLNKLEAGVFTENNASARLLEKLGFKKEGVKKQAVRAKSTGKVHDEIIYAMLRQEFKPLK